MTLEIVLLAITLGFLIGFLSGGFIEWDANYKINKRLQRELFKAFEENEELREVIYNSESIRQARR